MSAIGSALRQRDLRLLLSAGLISLTGDWMLRVGLAYYVYALTGSTLASAALLLASFVPQIVLGSLAGVFVDRWDQRRCMIVANGLLALGLLPLLAVYRTDQMWIVYVVTAWEGCVQQFFIPAEQSLLPLVVEDRHLVTANALNSQNNDLSRLIGSALGGVAAAAGGVKLLTLVDVSTFLVSGALLAGIRPILRADRVVAAGGALRARLVRLRVEWLEGLRRSVHQRVLRVIVVFLLVTCVGEGVMSTLFAPFVRTELHASAAVYGLVVAAQAIGGICGGLFAAVIGDRLRPAWAMGGCAALFGLIDLVLFLYPLYYQGAWPAVVLMIVVGLPGAVMNVAALTLLQRNTDNGSRGRVFGALGAVEGVAVVAGTIAAGFLGQTLGIIPTLAVQGCGYLVAGTLVLVLLRRDDVEPRTADDGLVKDLR